MSIWSQKYMHGLHWGYWIRRQDAKDWRWHIDNYEPCWDITATDGTRHCFQFGNLWASKLGDPFFEKPFQHYKTFPHDNWHFVDNPEIPHFLWPRAHNPSGSKDWVRFVKGSVLSTPKLHNTNGEDRINRLINHYSNREIRKWQDLVQIQPMLTDTRRHALICPVSAPNYVHYYSTTEQEWIAMVTAQLSKMNWTWEIRNKPTRQQRINNQLTDQLSTDRYGVTISQHSAAGLESIIAGVPAVVIGEHPTGELGTPWNEFIRGNIRFPDESSVLDWCRIVLGNIRHKQELFSGDYYET